MAGVAPALKLFFGAISAGIKPVVEFFQRNQELAKFLGFVLVTALTLATGAALVFLVSAVGPMIIAGFSLIAAWFPLIAILGAVALALGGIVYLIARLSGKEIDLGVKETLQSVKDARDNLKDFDAQNAATLSANAGQGAAAGPGAVGAGYDNRKVEVHVNQTIEGNQDPEQTGMVASRQIGRAVGDSIFSNPGLR